MGYELHITRKEHWSDEGPDIADSEWQAYIANDPEMKITGVAEAALPDGGVLRYESPLLAEWRKQSGDEVVWFDFRSGRIDVKNPDDETTAKMQQIAAALGGKVQGDEGEIYAPGSEAAIPAVAPPTRTNSNVLSFLEWPLRKQLLAAFLLGCLLLALKLLLVR
jgi:hypothetical protein